MTAKLSPAAQRLWEFEQKLKWLGLGLLWLLVGIPCLWLERAAIARLWEHFTWTGLRLLLFAYRNWTGAGIVLCVGFTLSALLSASFYELFGLMPWEIKFLEKRAQFIQQLGSRHPLWRIISGSRD
ncbi:MAG: hypothetical protein Q6J68_04105 [Thermostichales cyanobacterium SZTDM-1c_bins_54]